MFQNARLKLTAWYLAIIMAVSLLFSFSIYLNVNTEFRRFEKFQEVMREGQEDRFLVLFQQPHPRLDPQIAQHARLRLLTTLAFINLTILAIAGAAGYFLAGRTLRPIQKMVEEQNRFITDASHELRTPITSLRSEIEVGLRNKNLTITEAKNLLGSNLEETISLQTLSDNLLELSQVGKPQDKATLTDVRINHAVEAAIKKLNGSIKKKGILIEKDIPNITVRGVTDKIIELFVIILDNGIKYSPSKSKISVLAKQIDSKVRIEITDNGHGINPEDLPYIFDRFYRGTKSRSKEKVSGYGLGLAIAKEIVMLHNGTITIANTPPKGTNVTIELQS